MVADLQDDSNLNYVLSKMSEILNGKFAKLDEEYVYNYFKIAYGLFSKWKQIFELKNIEGSSLQEIQDQVKMFLLERNNGSWSTMHWANGNVPKDPNLKEALIELLGYKTTNGLPDFDDVKRRIGILVDKNSNFHIKGMSILFCTSVLFAHYEENFMIMDGPVRDIFQIKDDAGQLEYYDHIIQQSKSLRKKFSNLNMWHINKAYAVSLNRNQIKIGHLGDNLLDLNGTTRITL
jgi:hypothetical protein